MKLHALVSRLFKLASQFVWVERSLDVGKLDTGGGVFSLHLFSQRIEKLLHCGSLVLRLDWGHGMDSDRKWGTDSSKGRKADSGGNRRAGATFGLGDILFKSGVFNRKVVHFLVSGLIWTSGRYGHFYRSQPVGQMGRARSTLGGVLFSDGDSFR